MTRAPGLDRHAVQKLYQDPPAAFPPLVPIETNLRDMRGGTMSIGSGSLII